MVAEIFMVGEVHVSIHFKLTRLKTMTGINGRSSRQIMKFPPPHRELNVEPEVT